MSTKQFQSSKLNDISSLKKSNVSFKDAPLCHVHPENEHYEVSPSIHDRFF